MEHRKTKIVIVGAGAVGTSTAFDLSIQGLCGEIMLIDINEKKAFAEAMDMQQSVAYQSRKVIVRSGFYDQCGDADIVVITASAPYIMGQKRTDMLDTAVKITGSIVPPIMNSGFQGIFIVVTNPVDIIAYYVYKLSGLPQNQVIGTGTALDSARLRCMIADLIQVDPKSVSGFALGEHGDSQFVPWSNVTVGGKQIYDIISDNKARFGNVDLQQYQKDLIGAGYQIGLIKGTTNFAIAATVVEIIKVILEDENRVIPVSTFLGGKYGANDVYAGVPAVLGRQGIKELVELRLTKQEQESFDKSIAIIKSFIQFLPLPNEQ
jgi:L-lactate dehydrogenase